MLGKQTGSGVSKAARTDFRGDTRASLLGKRSDSVDDGANGTPGALTGRARRKLALTGVEEALAAKGLPLPVLASLPPACFAEACVRAWHAAVRELVVIKGRRRLVSASLINIVRVLVLEMRMSYTALEALTEVCGFVWRPLLTLPLPPPRHGPVICDTLRGCAVVLTGY